MSARRRFWPIALPGCLALVTVLLAAALWRDYDEARRVFNAQSGAYFQELSQHLTRTETMLDSLMALFDAVEQVDRDQLALFAQDLLERAPPVAAIHLHQRVTEAERPDLEARMRRQGYVNFTVHGSNDHQPAQAGVHFPILQIEPLTPDTVRLLGHDDYRTFPQGVAMDDAISSGEAIASFPLELARGGRGYRLYRALYATRLHRPPLDRRRLQALRVIGLTVDTARLLPAPRFDNGTIGIRLYHAQFASDDPQGWLIDRPGSAAPWARLLPPFTYSRSLPQIGQPLVLELTLQPDPGLVRAETLAEALGVALVLCLLLVSYLHLRHVRRQERRAAEQALRDSEARYRLLTESASDLITSHAPDGTCLYASPASRHLLGVEPETLMGGQLLQRVHPEDRQALDDFFQTVLSRLQPTTGRFRLTRTGAEPLWLETTACTIEASDGEVRHRQVVAISRDISERRRAELALERRASHDTLTGLPNRAYFLENLDRILKQTRQRQGWLALLFLDLDGFKGINDQLGHAAGDELLRVLARRTRTGLRQKDLVARLAGDEFTVVLEDMATREDIARIVQSLLERLNRPVALAGREIRVGVSIGIALYPDPQGAPLSLEDLVARADQAMYRAKRSGRHRYRFFDQAADDPPEAPPSPPSVAEAATKAVSAGKKALKSSSNPG